MDELGWRRYLGGQAGNEVDSEERGRGTLARPKRRNEGESEYSAEPADGGDAAEAIFLIRGVEQQGSYG